MHLFTKVEDTEKMGRIPIEYAEGLYDGIFVRQDRKPLSLKLLDSIMYFVIYHLGNPVERYVHDVTLPSGQLFDRKAILGEITPEQFQKFCDTHLQDPDAWHTEIMVQREDLDCHCGSPLHDYTIDTHELTDRICNWIFQQLTRHERCLCTFSAHLYTDEHTLHFSRFEHMIPPLQHPSTSSAH